MFWNKKEDSGGLPELPPVKLVSPPDIGHDESDEDTQNHGLPSFPDSPLHRGFSQAAIKDAVSSEGSHHESFAGLQPPPNRTFKTVEMDSSPYQPAAPLQNFIAPPAFERQSSGMRYGRESESRSKDVFVRIDKFYSARKALETTREKLNEIDELLRKIRETKLREEQELTAWEKELSEVKARVQDVVENIFDKIE